MDGEVARRIEAVAVGDIVWRVAACAAARSVVIKIGGDIKVCHLLLVGGLKSVSQAERLCGSGGGRAEDNDAKPDRVNVRAVYRLQ